MKNFKYYFSLLVLPLFLACNTDDDNNSEPEPEPIVANARVLYRGFCGAGHYYVEMNDVPLDSLPNGQRYPFYTFLDWPEEFWIDDLEVFVDYRNKLSGEERACPAVGPQPHRFVAREVLLPTATE
ncbi:hypothetical protein BST97_10510 [Nonlabens spongiae]|uniref:Uncharacterized protein n=1 Tax=Nonlabens spongiae TaxID=331648 RepID=A0A1W6MLB0_9FLAO|nr:hypothetical protein [Nonlabens spongiae]ARN78383.1 hypothetical protein BST97_10510 [Nonlabens spongiae]